LVLCDVVIMLEDDRSKSVKVWKYAIGLLEIAIVNDAQVSDLSYLFV